MRITAPKARLVAITSGHAYGARVLRRFETVGILPDVLIVTVQQHTPRRPPDRRLRSRVERARARARAWWRAWRRFRRVATRIVVVDSLADEGVRRALVMARADVLVLAGTGIVPAELLKLPSLVTLNAHPGLLPWVRGVCPLEHALLRGVPLGVTVHAVDAGIDTGPIVRRALLPVTSDDRDRISLSRRLEECAIDVLTQVVEALTLRAEPLSVHRQSSRHPYGRWVSDDQRARAIQLLAEGEAVRLYQEWRAVVGSDELPGEDGRLPGSSR